jgi:hypothetical protein
MVRNFVGECKIAGCIALNQVRVVDGPFFIGLVDLVIGGTSFSFEANRAFIDRTPFDISTMEPLIPKLSLVVIVSGRADPQVSKASTIA